MAKASGFKAAPTALTTAEPEPFSLGPPLQPTFDPLGLLPPAAADKLRALRVRSAEAYALVVPFSEQQELATEHQQAEQRLKRLLDPAHDGGFNLKLDDPRAVAQKKLVTKLADDLKRLNERSEARAASWRTTSGALTACENWLRHGKPRGVALEDFAGPEPRLLKGENNLLDAVENRRRRVRELHADLARIAASPMPSTYCKKKMREQVEVLAQRGAVDVSPLKHDNRSCGRRRACSRRCSTRRPEPLLSRKCPTRSRCWHFC